jgi:N-acetyl sugar amidotransferase
MKWCNSCVLPSTRPGITIGEDGVCNACKNHNTKKFVDWSRREASFEKIVNDVKLSKSGYDCVIPVSGGKDSTWQTIKCLEYGLTPLAVTWRTPGRTIIGQRNLDNLISLGVDHIDYQISPKFESKFMLRALERFGSTAIPMHMALFNIPLKIATKFNIPLVVWGENSAFEYGSDEENFGGHRLNSEWMAKFGVTHGTTALDWIGDGFSEKNLAAYFGPDDELMERSGLIAIFLGHYFEWDPEISLTAAKEHGFEFIEGGARTGLYDYADIDDDFISIHHWLKWYKFGFTRLHDNLSIEIRNKRLSRDEAINIISQKGEQIPLDDISKFCNFTNIDLKSFFEICEKFRNLDIWSHSSGKWKLNNYLIKNWS